MGMTEVAPALPIEFDADDPLVVDVAPRNGKWDISVSTTAVFRKDYKAHSRKMFERIDQIGKIDQEWTDRRVQGAPDRPHFRLESHAPIVVRAGEKVRFQCNLPFKVWASREPNVKVDLRSPENPFGWTKTQEGQAVDNHWEVAATAVADLAFQRFYKCVAWVDNSGTTILIDPDSIGN